MIEPELPSPSHTDALESLQRAYQGLRTLMDTILMILLVLTWSVNIFLLKQLSMVRNEIEERQRFIAEYEKNTVPVMSEFLTLLQGFAKKNPEFTNILYKYWMPTNNPAAAPVSPQPKITK